MNTIVVKNESEVIEKFKQEIEQRSEEALKTRGIFRVGLSGKFPKTANHQHRSNDLDSKIV